ncbi:hypothetical protein [Collinsella sp. UBA1693]|uniref:hypothetical protein n=1 Tax=Collinsella sp. UBA1693 TaxID=1946385 RepID=UPI00257F04C2|nr:hypothetical protein [Collinsella sp. UBA1693]
MGDSGTSTTRERQLIDAAQQVSHLKDREVRFELMDEREAERFLRESNFFKMKAFARRFPCYANPGSKLGKLLGPISRMAVEQLGFDCELASLTKRAPIVHGFTVLALCYTHLVESKGARFSSSEGSGRRVPGREPAAGKRNDGLRVYLTEKDWGRKCRK